MPYWHEPFARVNRQRASFFKWMKKDIQPFTKPLASNSHLCAKAALCRKMRSACNFSVASRQFRELNQAFDHQVSYSSSNGVKR